MRSAGPDRPPEQRPAADGPRPGPGRPWLPGVGDLAAMVGLAVPGAPPRGPAGGAWGSAPRRGDDAAATVWAARLSTLLK
ncbi:hypothetical protein SAMN04488543_2741 [Friedmanniella luteola]|uniref:Uncharacterized protein n=1 Tax=Friedmanniella luteola TaxID=546871 RepID=A0A1H1WII0_9ACTN|nr:hypothetical protein [Friedmanniella luteola]SDS96933.1 hypothetical protein SAMN04488543_2741 [Friedmanniella luteola]